MIPYTRIEGSRRIEGHYANLLQLAEIQPHEGTGGSVLVFINGRHVVAAEPPAHFVSLLPAALPSGVDGTSANSGGEGGANPAGDTSTASGAAAGANPAGDGRPGRRRGAGDGAIEHAPV